MGWAVMHDHIARTALISFFFGTSQDIEEWPLCGNPRSEVKRALLDLEITLCKFDSSSAISAHRGLQISLHPANHLHYLQVLAWPQSRHMYGTQRKLKI